MTPTGVAEFPLFNMASALTLPRTCQNIRAGVRVRGISDYLHDYDEDATPSLDNLDPQRVDQSFSQYWKALGHQTQKTSSVGANPKRVKEVSILYTSLICYYLQKPSVINAPRRNMHGTYNHDTNRNVFCLLLRGCLRTNHAKLKIYAGWCC